MDVSDPSPSAQDVISTDPPQVTDVEACTCECANDHRAVDVSIGDLFVYRSVSSDNNAFDVGRFIKLRNDGTVHFQHLGNYSNEDRIRRGIREPFQGPLYNAWVDKKCRWYCRDRPQVRDHRKFDDEDTAQALTMQHILFGPFKLTASGKLPQSLYNKVISCSCVTTSA